MVDPEDTPVASPPVNTASTGSAPGGREPVEEQLATPATTGAEQTAVPPTSKVTSPSGVVPGEVTVADNVTGWPVGTTAGETEVVVVVEAKGTTTPASAGTAW